MKDTIVLFAPDAKGQYTIPPYALLYLERAVRDLNLKVIVLDEAHDTNWKSEIQKISHRILIAGVSVILGTQISGAIDFSKAIKTSGNIPIVWGGWFPTWQGPLCLKENYVDFVIEGQGEESFRDLVIWSQKTGVLKKDLVNTDILGLSYILDNQLYRNRNKTHCGFDKWPPVDYALVDMRRYFTKTHAGKGKTIRYFASEGCPNLCNFCFMSRSWKGKWYAKPAASVFNDLKYFISLDSDISHVVFEDNNFFSDKQHVLTLCEGFIKHFPGITWSASAHIGSFLKDYDPHDIQRIRESGCRSIASGAESGDQHILDQLNKKLLIEETEQFVRIVKGYGIVSCFSFMVMFPGNPRKDLIMTLKLVMRLIREDRSFSFFINIYAPAISNNFLHEAMKQGFSLPEDLNGFAKYRFDPLLMPWISKKLVNKLRYFTLFYFRYYSRSDQSHNEPHSGFLKFFLLISRPLIRFRFLLESTNFCLLGMIYSKCFEAVKSEKTKNNSIIMQETHNLR